MKAKRRGADYTTQGQLRASRVAPRGRRGERGGNRHRCREIREEVSDRAAGVRMHLVVAIIHFDVSVVLLPPGYRVLLLSVYFYCTCYVFCFSTAGATLMLPLKTASEDNFDGMARRVKRLPA